MCTTSTATETGSPATETAPPYAGASASFSRRHPLELSVTAAPFPLARKDGTTVGTCTYAGTPSGVTGVFNDDVEAGDQKGFLWFQVAASSVEIDTPLTFSVNWYSIDLAIENSGEGSGTPCRPSPFKKYGWAEGDGRNGYAIEVGQAGQTLNTLGQATITDRLTTGSVVDGATTINLLSHTFVEDSFVLSCFVEGAAAGVTTPQLWPSTWVPVFNDAKTEFTLTIDAAAEGLPCGDFSRMHLAYKTQPVGDAVKNTPGASTLYGYGNAVDMGGFTSSSDAVAYAAGGGGVSNTSVMFSIVKAVDGDAASLVDPSTEFQVEVQVAVQVEGEDTPRVITLTVDAASFSGPIPDGRAITIREVNLPAVAGVQWSGTPAVAGASVVDNGDGTFSLGPACGQAVALVLTNTADAEPQFGALTATKAIAADSEAASKDVVYGFEVVCAGATYAGGLRRVSRSPSRGSRPAPGAS